MVFGRRALAAAVAFMLSIGLTMSALRACTTFCVSSDGRVLFGRNYDFEFGDGLVLSNARGLRKTGYVPRGPHWLSRYGSLTFNQFGREFPMGGINEAGLVVALMWHERAEYPAEDGRAPLGVLEWIQYQLDTASTIDDVRRSDDQVRISGSVPLHYLISDRSGRAATVEFLGGKLHFRTGEALPVSVLANDTYEDSLAFWRKRNSRGTGGASSNARFSRAAEAVSRFSSTAGADAVDRAFSILANVAQRSTRWSVVYDQTEGVVRFRTAGHPAIRTIQLDGLELGCRSQPRVLDVNAKLSGDVTARMEQYTEARNRALIATSCKSFSATRHTPAEEIERIVTHPSRASCTT